MYDTLRQAPIIRPLTRPMSWLDSEKEKRGRFQFRPWLLYGTAHVCGEYEHRVRVNPFASRAGSMTIRKEFDAFELLITI